MNQPVVRQSDGASGKWLSRLHSLKGLDELRDSLRAYYPGLDVRNAKTIAIIGAAGEGERLAGICDDRGIEVVAFTDDHPDKLGKQIGRRRVVSLSRLETIGRGIPVVIASHRVLGAVERLRGRGFKTVLPFAALQAAAPDIFKPHMFYEGLLEDLWENRERYLRLNELLADRRSRDVFDAVLGYRQTFDPMLLKPVLDADDLYVPKNLIEFSNEEVYVEGGAFDGDTIRSFINKVGGRFKQVYAFEPDPATFAKLKEHFASEPRVKPINAGLSHKTGVLRFRNDASRGAIFTDVGDIQMPVQTLDEALNGRPATYIKLNIEGAEIDALHGSAATIEASRPKLALSVYHRPSDLWRIPKLVQELGPDYRLYLRQHDGGIIETVLYALPTRGNESSKR